MNIQILSLKQLDKQLKEWQLLSKKWPTPKAGWVKTIRAVLKMPAEHLAKRMGLTRGRILQLEHAEVNDAVTLRTLKDVANALDCEFVYAIVPKGDFSLEKIIKKKAEEIAQNRIERVAHTMSLEAQSVNAKTLEEQKNELTRNLAEHLDKKFWKLLDEIKNSRNEEQKKELLIKKLKANEQKKK